MKTRNLKRLLSLALCLCMVAGLLPVTVLAAGASDPAEDGFLWLTTDVVADNVAPTTGTKLYPGGATTEGAVYDQGTNTLTLTDFSGPTLNLIAREMGSGFKIVVNGTNALKCVRVYGGTYGGALTIEGTGTLTINNSADTAYYAGIDLRGEGVETALAIGAEVTLHVTGRTGSGAVSVAPAPTNSTPITWGGTLSNGQLASSPIILSLPAMYMEDPYGKYNVYQDGEGKYYGLKMGREEAPPFDFVYSVYEVTYADGTYTLGADTVPGMVGISEDVKNTWLADKTPVWSDWSNWTISGDATMGGRLDTLSFLPGASQGPVITVTGSVPAEVKVGDSYNVSLSATGSGITWSQEGQWPDGISLTDNQNGTAAISGSPTAAGSYTFSVKATDGSGQSATREFTLRVTNEVSQLSWTTARLAPSTVSLDAVNDYTLTLVPSAALTLPAGTVLSIRAQGVDFTGAAVSDSGFSVSNGGLGSVGIRCDQEAAIPAGGITLTLTGVKNPGAESQIYPTLGALSWDADGVTYQLPETTMESIRYTGRVLLEGGVCYLIKGNQIYFSVTAYGDGDVTATLHYYTGSDEPRTKIYTLERNSADPTAEGTVDFPADAAELNKTVFSLPGAEPIEWTFDINRNTATPQMEVTVSAAAGVPLDGACILIQDTYTQRTNSMAYDSTSGQTLTMELDKSWAGETVTVSLAVYQGEYIKLAESDPLTISATELNQVTLTAEETDYQSYTLRFQTKDGEPVDASGLSGTLEWKEISLGLRESYLFQNTLQASDLTLKVSNPGEELARDYQVEETYTEGTGLAVDNKKQTITVTLEAWDRSAGITGVVTCGEGVNSEPVAGMRVSAEQTLDGRSFQSVAVSGADGRYTIPSLVPGVEAKITAAAVGYPDYKDTVNGGSLTENGTCTHDIALSGTQGTIFVSLSQLPIPGTAANGSTVQSPTFSVWQPVPVTEGEDDKPAEPAETKTENEAIEVTQVATTGGYYLTLPEGDWGGEEVDVTVTAPALAQTGSVVSQGRGGVIRVQLDQRGYGRASFNGLVQMGVVNLGTPTSRDLYYVFVYDSEGELTSVLSPTVSKSIQLPAGEYTAYFLGSLRCTEEVAAAARWSSSWNEIQAADLVAAGAVKQTFTMEDGKETALPDLTIPSDADKALPGSYVRAPHVTPEGEIYEITGVISLPAGARLSNIQCSDLDLISAAKVGGKTAMLSLGVITPASGSDTGVIPFTIYCRTARNSASDQSDGTVHKVDVTYADANGAEKTVTLGVLSVAYSKLLTLQAPQRVDTAELTVSGRTEANAEVELYLEQTLLTTVRADGNGRYTATLTLPVNGNRASDHLIMAKLRENENTVAYAPVSYVPGEAILTALSMTVENTVLGDQQEIPMSVNGGSVNLTTWGSHDHSFQFTATFENADKLREIGDGAKILLRVDTDADSRILVAKDIGNGKFRTDEEVFPSGAMPTQVTPLYASNLPDTAADLTAEEAVLAGVQAAEGQKALEALLDAYQSGLTPENADRMDLLRAYAGLYENVAVAGDPDAADADIVLSDTAPDAAGDYEMTFTTQTGMVTGTQAGALVQSLANNPNYQKSDVDGGVSVGSKVYSSLTNYTRLFFCDKAGRPITDPETIAAGTFAGTVSLTFTVGASSGGTEVCWTRITTLTPGAKFPSYADNGALSGFEPAAAVIRNAGGETLLLRNASLGVGGTTVLSAGTGETTTTTTTETRRLNQEEMQVYFDSGVAGSDISYETYANFVMDLVPLSDDTKFMGQTFDYFKNTKALFGEATECEQLGTIADVLEGYRKNLLEIYDTFSGLPTDQCKDLAKLARMSLDALGDVSEIVDQAQVTHLAVSRITDEMSKVGILVGPLEFTGAGTLYNVSTAFVGLAANATNDQTKAEAQRQFIGFSYLYEQVYNRATAMGYKQGSGGDAGNIEEVTTVTKTITTNRQRHYTWVENGKLWALVKVIETTTETTTVELRITYYTGVYRTIPISSDTVETQRYWEEKEVVDDPGSDGWSSDTTTEVTENGESVPPSGGSGVEIKHDPSGYVYEAVLSNPVAGATVTLYQNTADFEPEYNGGDVGKPDYGTVINTDDIPATNDRKHYVDYTDAPQINPMTSDQEGHYGWDVPQGLWYVEAEAAGYQTGSSNSDRAAIVSITDSSGTVNWLPVLPPQLDVNIPMVDDSVPTVTSVTPQTDGVYIQFSKYMEEDSLTADSFKLWVDGQTVSFAVDKVDSEQAPSNIDYPGGTAPSYTSLVRLVPTGTSLTAGQQVKVAVNAGNENLRSYAGTDFPNTYVSNQASVAQQASVAAPSAVDISSGTYYGPQQVTLSCNTPGAEIWYTTGSGEFDPNTWTRYTGSIPVSRSVTLRFIAVKAGMLDSAIQAITLQIETPVISGGGTTPGGDDTPGTDPGGTTPGGGGGGGGGGGSSGYSISVPSSSSIKGGSITVSPRSADKGDTVTITVKPDDGYELNTLTVTDAKGNELEVTDKGSGKYTFSVPGSSVKIQVSFKAIAEQVANPFTDVAAGAYYEAAVLWAVANGVTNGTTATTFSPNVTVTRAHMVTFLWRAHGAPKAAGSNPFTDVSSSAYYYDAVLWAVEHGVTNGTTATTFGPNAPVTRAQAVTFQWRASGSPAVSGGSFSDVAADAYYSGAVAWAVANGITNGTAATTFSPDTPVSRAQAVTFLWRELA